MDWVWMLVSQRPADIESTVISQCGTWLVLRLTNSADQQHVARFLPDGLSGMTRVLPALALNRKQFLSEKVRHYQQESGFMTFQKIGGRAQEASGSQRGGLTNGCRK